MCICCMELYNMHYFFCFFPTEHNSLDLSMLANDSLVHSSFFFWSPNQYSIYRCATNYLPIFALEDILVLSRFGLLQIKLIWTLVYIRSHYVDIAFITFREISRSEITRSYKMWMFSFLRNWQTVFQNSFTISHFHRTI